MATTTENKLLTVIRLKKNAKNIKLEKQLLQQLIQQLQSVKQEPH